MRSDNLLAPQCCRASPSACWRTRCEPRRRCCSNSGSPASASCGGSTPARPERPAEMPLGPGAWGYVPGNKVAVGSFLLSHCCSSRFPGCGFGMRPDLTPTAACLFCLLRPGQAFWGRGSAWCGPRSEEATPASWLLLVPGSTHWAPPDGGARSLKRASHLNSARPPQTGSSLCSQKAGWAPRSGEEGHGGETSGGHRQADGDREAQRRPNLGGWEGGQRKQPGPQKAVRSV